MGNNISNSQYEKLTIQIFDMINEKFESLIKEIDYPYYGTVVDIIDDGTTTTYAKVDVGIGITSFIKNISGERLTKEDESLNIKGDTVKVITLGKQLNDAYIVLKCGSNL